jgi:hypothetical protein
MSKFEVYPFFVAVSTSRNQKRLGLAAFFCRKGEKMNQKFFWRYVDNARGTSCMKGG